MLHVNKTHTFHLPRAIRPLELAPIPAEDDEIIREIEETARGEQWTLEAGLDVHALAEFWGGVEQELKNDPMWFTDNE